MPLGKLIISRQMPTLLTQARLTLAVLHPVPRILVRLDLTLLKPYRDLVDTSQAQLALAFGFKFTYLKCNSVAFHTGLSLAP